MAHSYTDNFPLDPVAGRTPIHCASAASAVQPAPGVAADATLPTWLSITARRAQAALVEFWEDLMPIRTVLIAVSAAGLLAGCVPLPLPFYVGDESAGRLSYNSCSLGDVPEGLVLSRAGIMLLVSVRQWRGDEVVHIRYDIGKGHRVQLAGREVAVNPRDGSAPRIGAIDRIDLWDRVPDDGYETLPARSAGLGPPDLLMDDAQLPPLPTGPRPILPVRHYWVATHVQTGHADRVWVKLPDLTVDGASIAFPEIRFDRRFRAVLAPLNC